MRDQDTDTRPLYSDAMRHDTVEMSREDIDAALAAYDESLASHERDTLPAPPMGEGDEE